MASSPRLRGRHCMGRPGLSRPLWAKAAGCLAPTVGLGRPHVGPGGPTAGGPAFRPSLAVTLAGDGEGRRVRPGGGGGGGTDMYGDHRNDSDCCSWSCRGGAAVQIIDLQYVYNAY